ncbi:hypothetical protein ACFVZA_10530 [Streptomyces bottropensis]|uniref:hypothetical protein n=1 Tax=Streptomyces bottropensis TaxID=42235 RepID=UPI00367FCD89
MTDNGVGSSELSDDRLAADVAAQAAGKVDAGGAGVDVPGRQGDIAGLVLLINTLLGGLGTLYATTKSTVITLVSALIVLLIIIVVLVVKRRGPDETGPGRRDDRSAR